jgi:undecaprenyl-phosphate glucose phosphotransferase
VQPRRLLLEHSSLLPGILRLLDVTAVVLAGLAAYHMRFPDPHWSMQIHYKVALIQAAILTCLVFPAFGLYQSWRGRTLAGEAGAATAAWSTVAVALVLTAALTKTTGAFSRYWMVVWFLGAEIILVLLRGAQSQALAAARTRGWHHHRTVIAGTGDLGRTVARRIRASPWAGIEIYGFVDASYAGGHEEQIEGLPVLGHIQQLARQVQVNGIDEVWIALPLSSEQQVHGILYDLRHSTVTIRYVPDIFGFRLLNHSVTEVAGLPVVNLNFSPMVGVNRLVKDLEDKVLATLILSLVSPLLLVIGLAIRLDSRGPVLFKQLRHGWDGRPINVYKFRTMTVCEDGHGRFTQATRDDPRVTRVGRFLRRTSVDELPQLINVLQGRMSLVGPRPHPIALSEQYKDLIDAYMQRHRVKPGLTGWAQVNGWRGQTETVNKMRKRVEYDLYYIEHWSLWFDLRILLMTPLKGLLTKNAC